MNRILTVPVDGVLLRTKAKKVKNPQSTEVILAVQTMKRLALEWEQKTPGQKCAGLAATQIGVTLRIVILRNLSLPKAPQNPLVLTSAQAKEMYGDYDTDIAATRRMQEAIWQYKDWIKAGGGRFDPFMVLYNPVYVASDGMQESEEGCLSVPGIAGIAMRPQKSTFYFYDHCLRRQPKAGEYEATDFAAAVICHEIDHLNGGLFTDNALKTWDIKAKAEYEKRLAEHDAKYHDGCKCGDLYCEAAECEEAEAAERARIEGICEDDTEYERYESYNEAEAAA